MEINEKAGAMLAGIDALLQMQLMGLEANPYAEKRGDGLYYCKVCGEPLTEKVGGMAGGMTLPEVAKVECRCQRDAIRADERNGKRERCFKAAPGFASAHLAAEDNTPVAQVIRDYASRWVVGQQLFSNGDGSAMIPGGEPYVQKKPDGKGICFWGNTGTGKSTYAAALLNLLLDKGVPVRFETAYGLIEAMNNDAEAAKESIQRPSLLVIDDVGADSKTSHKQALLCAVLDARISSGKPMVVTTNIPKERLANPADEQEQRIFSRLNGLVWVKVVGVDHRAENSKAVAEELRSRLLTT